MAFQVTPCHNKVIKTAIYSFRQINLPKNHKNGLKHHKNTFYTVHPARYAGKFKLFHLIRQQGEHIMRIQLIKILTAFLALATTLTLSCSSAVGFRVIDKQTNEDIKDYKVHVQGHGVDKKLEAGEKIKLSNGFFSPPSYYADIEADGYSKNADYKLQRRFCFSCFKMFGTAGRQTVYMSRDNDSSAEAVAP
jgi:hypothetical protein